jgi:phage-related minor tail protein
VQLLHRQSDGAAAVVLAVMRGLVAAGAESPLAGSGQHDGADLARVAGTADRVDELVAGAAAKRVHLVGPVDGDPGRAVAHVVEDVFVVHGVE